MCAVSCYAALKLHGFYPLGKKRCPRYDDSMPSKKRRGEIGEKEVADVLSAIEGKYASLNNVTFLNETSGMTHQIDHILIHPHGVFVIETKNYYGTVLCEEDGYNWSRLINGKKSKTGNPLLQNKSHAITLHKMIKGNVKVVPVVVFVRNNAPYTPDENVINLVDLPLFIDSYPYERLLSLSEMKRIEGEIKKRQVDMSNAEHVENIGYLKQYQRTVRAEITYALERGKCPWCESPISSKGDDYYCTKCKFGFHL